MIGDLDARITALDPQRSFIVQAPAGSGKTGLLVYRMLTLLATVEKPQQVLSITFTRKATSEMRERLLELIEFAEQGVSSDDAFEQQGIELAAGVLAQDRLHNWRLLDAPHQLQILTIDSFCAKLTASMPWLSRLGDRPRTTDQAGEHYAAAIEQLFGELLDSQSAIAPYLTTVLSQLDFNYNKTRQLFASMLAKRDQWLRHLLQGDLEQMRNDLEQAWQNVITEQLLLLDQMFSEDSLVELCDLAAYAAPNHPQANSSSPLRIFERYNSGDTLTPEHWHALAHMLLTQGKLRKQVNKRLGFIAKSAETVRMHELLKSFEGDAALASALLDVSVLPDGQFDSADWQQLLALEKVLKSLAALLQLKFRASGECDHSEVTQRANLALRELENPTDLGLRLDAHLQHILVDEFQDTSHGQIELLKKLTTGWDDSNDNKTLFLVGDPMQSIYRFREADVSLFLQVTDNQNTRIFPEVEIEALKLTENFRSSKSLVDWFNYTFERSFPARDNVLSGAIRYSSASCSKSDSEPACEYLLAHDKEQEADLLLESVKRSIDALPEEGGQVAILVKARTQLKMLLPKLQTAGISYSGIDIQPLADLQSVIDVLALCKAIAREDDRVAWISLLRGPWCGISLADIKSLVGEQNTTVWSQLSQADLSSLDADSSARLMRFIATMQTAVEQRQQVPLSSLVKWAWCDLGGENTLYGASKQDIDTVFDLLAELERGADLASMRELDSALQGLYAQPQTEDDGSEPKLVVSTMHKSKGLQYHTVILPGLNSGSRNAEKEVLMWAEAQNIYGESELLLAPFTDQNTDSLHYQYLRHLDSKRSSNEAVRLMYVATTRAEKKLILIASAKMDKSGDFPKAPTKGALLSTVWDALERHFNFTLAAPESVSQEQDLSQTLTRLPEKFKVTYREAVNWQVNQQLNNAPSVPNSAIEDAAQIEYQWATEVATGVGIVLHDWLQFNSTRVLETQIDESLKKRWRAELLNLRVPANVLAYAVKRLCTALENIQSHHQAHFLFQEQLESNNEFTLSTVENGSVSNYRLDRTFVDAEGTRWIVDYKSTVHEDQHDDMAEFAAEQVRSRHKAQLEKYGSLFAQVDARPIKLAVYFPLLKQLITWPYES